jgi:hypothetical protein
MTVTTWDSVAATSVEDNTSETLTVRLRAHLQALAIQRLPIIYREVAKGLQDAVRLARLVATTGPLGVVGPSVIRSWTVLKAAELRGVVTAPQDMSINAMEYRSLMRGRVVLIQHLGSRIYLLNLCQPTLLRPEHKVPKHHR